MLETHRRTKKSKNIAMARHCHKHGEDCYLAVTDKTTVTELPELTSKLVELAFGADFEPDEPGADFGFNETIEWVAIYPLDELPLV